MNDCSQLAVLPYSQEQAEIGIRGENRTLVNDVKGRCLTIKRREHEN